MFLSRNFFNGIPLSLYHRTEHPSGRFDYKKRFCEVPMQPVPWWLVVLLDRIAQPALKQKLPLSDDEINHHRSFRSHVAKCFAPGRGGEFFVSCTSGQNKCSLRNGSTDNFSKTTLT